MDEPNRNSPRPLQIIDFVGDGFGQRRDINLHKENLDSILKQAGDRRIAIVSIVGPMRQGKSFLLCFMLRYLQALENDESDWMDWDDMKKPLEGGFVWRTGVDHETNGMVMWSKPFIVKSNDTEIAIILLDTQGTFDEFTTVREMTSIVGLSLLISSCTIFNFFTNLSEDVLTSLETYIEYGKLALSTPARYGNGDTYMGTEGSSKPFQKLLFLIRDWNTPSEFPYGDKGGEKFLEKKLQIKPGQAENAQKVRKTLKGCFEKLDCFLMPDPGEKAKEAGFNGSLAQLSKKFADKVEELINKLLDPDEIPLNSVLGSPVVASDMLNYFEKYVEVFNGDELPDPATLINATAHIANTTLVNSFLRKYLENIKKKQRGKKFLPEKDLLKIHRTCMEEAIRGFQKNKKLGNPEMIEKFEEELRFQIKEKFDSIEDENSRKKSKIIETAVAEAQKFFKNSISQALRQESYLEKRLKSVLKDQKVSAIEMFKEQMNVLSLDGLEIQQLETNLKELLDENRFMTGLMKTTAHAARFTIGRLGTERKSNWSQLFGEKCSMDYGNLLETGVCSDVTLAITQDDKVLVKIPAHKCILSSRSPVFAAMFRNEMKESSTGEVVIEDISPTVMKIVLNFIYSGNVDDNWESFAPELIYSADKYELKDLMKFIDENVESACTPENVMRIMKLASLHKLNLALQTTKKYMKDNIDVVLDHRYPI